MEPRAPESAADHQETRPDQPFADMAVQCSRVHEWLANQSDRVRAQTVSYTQEDLREKFGFACKGEGSPRMILSEDVAVELGHPSTQSSSLVLTTFQPDRIEDGRVSILGPDLGEVETGARLPFAQVVLLAVKPESYPDPFELEQAQYLMHRLPGYMVRSGPERLGVRVSKEAVGQGFDLSAVGSALVHTYHNDFPEVVGVEVVLATGDPELLKPLKPIAAEAAVLSGKHRKLVLGVDGEAECNELDCETCDEQETCDNLRDVVIKRRERSR
jgi:hypothetical protein